MDEKDDHLKEAEITVHSASPVDDSDPRNWSSTYKWSIVILVAALSAVVQLSTIIAAPVSPSILAHFHSDNALYRTLIVSIWELGEIVAPLLWGPLSELYGRHWVLNIANILFVAFLAGNAASTNIQMLIAFRFLSGSATAGSTIGPGIVSDLWPEESRGRAMSIMSMTGALGPVIGPIIGSYLSQKAGWRWAFWLPTIAAGVLSILFVIIYRETYSVTLAKRKAGTQPKDGDETAGQLFFNTILRPLRLLIRSPMLILVTIYLSVVYGFTYLIMTNIAPIFQILYHFSEGASGLCFLGLCLGLVLGAFLCSFLLDHYLRTVRAKSTISTPEQRLPPVLIACLIMSIGFIVFGWTVHFHVQYVVPIIGTGIIGFGLVATTITLQTYVVDAFGVYAVSATSAMLVPRNACAAFLPLAGTPLFNALGYGWGGTLLGLVVLVFSPMPVAFMWFGTRLKGRDLGDV
ncbi:MFS general substrate transporter [Aspergillus sclerotioniger CBS 115572]|uniref:MFS general substrate transporter n=1 Tax=Aspergillus sclerotioniger CBS 115572 TaxID=1450535 RepID=A0A317WUP1_9EURO|nr:MFS general substrate transporter [Aspergillus sclerotioniger CBS 115572]PWY87970.1 MFS general substrate transporter [Aspergillus sclerotioniger CBS 115572]